MKNRRLNVLFIAIIAVAAAPQALQDMGRLVSVAQERAETEFWSVFLSYQTTEAKGTETRGATELMAARRSSAVNSCPLERVRLRVDGATRNSQSNENSTPARSSQQVKKANAKAQPAGNQPVEQVVDGDETVAAVYRVRTTEFSEEEKDALRAASLHARDTDKLADAASKTSLASFLPGTENLQIRVKQAMEMDRALRQRVRFPRDRSESDNSIPAPNPDGSM
jgi:hypothetical protein